MKYEELINAYLKIRCLDSQKELAIIDEMRQFEEQENIFLGRHLYYHAQLCYEQGNLEQSMNYALKGIQIMLNQPYTPEISKCYNLMGVLYNYMGDHLQALDWYLDALDIVEKNKDQSSVTSIYNNIGCIYDELDDNKTAIIYFEKALASIDPKDRESYTVVLINLAFMYCESDEWEKVSAFCDSAYNMQKGSDVNLKSVHMAMINGMLAYHYKDIEKVKEQFTFIIDKSEKHGLTIDDFNETINWMPKMIDKRLKTEIQHILKILHKIADEKQLLDAQIKLLEIEIEFNELIENEEAVIKCSKLYYQILKEQKKERLRILLEGINMKLQLKQMIKEQQKVAEQAQLYQQRAQRDVLTGLYNRFVLKDKLEALLTSAISDQKTVGLLIVDIDDFKQYNDCYGHIAGDECIKALASVMMRMSDDKICFLRYGGDEFLGLFYDIDATTIKSMVQLIYSEIRALNIEHEASTTSSKVVSVTEGAFICVPKEKENLYDLIAIADDQLYKGKNSGKAIEIMHREN